MFIEKLHEGIHIKKKLDECKEKELKVCSNEVYAKLDTITTDLWSWADMCNEERLELLKHKIQSSLEFDELAPNGEARLMALGHQLLQQSVQNNCLESIHNVGSKCRIKKTQMASILSKDINNLTEYDVITLLYI